MMSLLLVKLSQQYCYMANKWWLTCCKLSATLIVSQRVCMCICVSKFDADGN